jgi:hypothetical protein
MNKKTKILIAMLVSLGTMMQGLGYDANNPASYIVNYIVPSDTSFSVLLCGSEQNMNFNPINGSTKSVEPDCQAIASNIPWANVTNNGNVVANYTVNLESSNPAWVELTVGSDSLLTDGIIVTNTTTSPAGWMNVATNSAVQLYARADFTNAPAGTTSNKINISSK